MTRRSLFVCSGCIASLCIAPSAFADVILACTFPTLPTAIMRFPEGVLTDKTMEVGGRPPVALTEGQGTGRLITAEVDGYTFRFVPADSVMDVDSDGETLVSEEGRCATVGGPVTQSPLQIADPRPNTEAPTASISAIDPDNSADKGQWVVKEDKSTFDDTRTVVLSLKSNETVRGQFGPEGPAMIYLRCMENTTVLYLWINDLFLSDIQGFGVIDYRIDDRAAAKLRVESSTDNKALGLWGGGKSIPFIKELIWGKQVAFRTIPYNESPVEFSFDLTGLDVAIAPLREACAW